MIDVRGLTFAYDKVKVLDNMSFSLGSGQLVCGTRCGTPRALWPV